MLNLVKLVAVLSFVFLSSISAHAQAPKLDIRFQGQEGPFDGPILLVRGPAQHPITIAVRARPSNARIQNLRVTVNGKTVGVDFSQATGQATCRIPNDVIEWDNLPSTKIVAQANLNGIAATSNELTAVGVRFPLTISAFLKGGRLEGLSYKWGYTSEELNLSVPIPLLGRFGPEFKLEGGMEIGLQSFDFDTDISGGVVIRHGLPNRPKGSTTVMTGGKGSGSVRQTSPEAPFQFTSDEYEVFLEVKRSFTLVQLTILDMIKPGATKTIKEIPLVGEFLSASSPRSISSLPPCPIFTANWRSSRKEKRRLRMAPSMVKSTSAQP